MIIETDKNEGNKEKIGSEMILTELKQEDMKIEEEINTLQTFEDYTYEITFDKILQLPEWGRIAGTDNECFSLRFEKFDNQIAAGYSNGYICVFNTDGSGAPRCMKASEYPVTCIRWKPHNDFKPKNILVSVTADGKIHHWHTSSGKVLYSMEESDNPIMCLDYSPDGLHFATGGSDKLVRLYDDNTKTLLRVMKPANFISPGHSNRIFCIKFHHENLNLMASGGWDNTIQFYDIRQGTIINNLYGPHVCGDSVDMKGHYLLTGSWAIKDQLQLWDIRTMKLVQNIAWEDDKLFNSTYVYTAQFSKHSNNTNLFGVGGSNNNICRIFENDTSYKKPQITTKYMSSPCYTLDFSHNGNLFAYGCGDGKIRILKTSQLK